LDTFSFQGPLFWCSVDLVLIIPHCSRDPSGRHFPPFPPSRRPRLWDRLLTPLDIFLLYLFWTFSRLFAFTYSRFIQTVLFNYAADGNRCCLIRTKSSQIVFFRFTRFESLFSPSPPIPNS